MGSSQSSRKLTITNDEEEGNVIKISDAVAKRLSENAATAAKGQQQQPQQPSLPPLPTSTAVARQSQRAHAGAPEYTISALEIKMQKEQEIKEQEQYWKARLSSLEQKHQQINQTFDEEYKKALTYFDDCRGATITKGVVRPCGDVKDKVLQCFKQNPEETLRCSDLVAQFSNCVDQRRATLTKCN